MRIERWLPPRKVKVMNGLKSLGRDSISKIEQLCATGKIRDAIDLGIQLEQACSDDAKISRFVGMFFVSRNWYSEYAIAADMLNKSLGNFPNDAPMHYLYAYACWYLGRKHKALENCLKAISLAPNDTMSYQLLGMYYLSESKYTEAYIALSAGLTCSEEKQRLQVWHKLAEAMMREVKDVHFEFDDIRLRFKLNVFNGSAMTTSCHHLHGIVAEAEELHFLKEALGQCDTIVEVGILVGNHLVYFMKTLKPKKIIAFDVNPRCIAETERNISFNRDKGIDARVELHHKVVGCINGPVSFEGQSLEGITLSAIVKESVDFIKIDVDGMELEVLEGASDLINQSRPKMMIEVNRENMPEFLGQIEVLDYSVQRRFDEQNYSNFFFSTQILIRAALILLSRMTLIQNTSIH